MIHLVHIPDTENPADVLMKSLVHPTLYALTKPYIFYTKNKHPDKKKVGKKKKIETPVSSSIKKQVTWADLNQGEISSST